MWTRALATADASCGGKAFGLARLIAAGLRVPDGFVIDDRAFRVATGDAVRQVIESGARSTGAVVALHEAASSRPIDQHAIANAEVEVGAVLEPDPGISLVLGRARPEQLGHALEQLAQRIETVELPEELVTEVSTRARRLGGPFAVRSSATLEDGEAGAAAGVFSSRTAVALDELWPAIRSVWLSALTPLAAAYARRREGALAISVIVQRFVEGERVTVYTRPPGKPDANALWWQHGSEVCQIARDDSSQLLAAERAIGATGGADLELVMPLHSEAGPEPPFGDGGTWLEWQHASFVQVRPIVHPVIAPRSAPPPIVLVPLQDGRRWTLDLAHNPDPLSIAQTDLVHRVEAAAIAPWSARVCAGYLYTTPVEEPARGPVGNAAEIQARSLEIQRAMTAALDPADPPPPLAEALDRYLAFFEAWAKHGALIAAGRAAYPHPAKRGSAVESRLLVAAQDGAARDALAGLGVLAPAWDVAVPTFAERPGLLEDALARARVALRDRPLDHTTDETPAGYDEATTIAELAEIDDFAFARAQWLVRRAILDRADALGIAREDAFWIPLDDLLHDQLDPVEVSRRASGARAAAARAATWNMPVVVGDDSSTRDRGVALAGIGSGHRITGRVRRFESLASAIVVGRGDIVVTRAVTPALAVIVIGCAAIISETGRVLDHGAAMARELGIPYVVSCRDAWSQLADGMIVSIDNDRVTITS